MPIARRPVVRQFRPQEIGSNATTKGSVPPPNISGTQGSPSPADPKRCRTTPESGDPVKRRESPRRGNRRPVRAPCEAKPPPQPFTSESVNHCGACSLRLRHGVIEPANLPLWRCVYPTHAARPPSALAECASRTLNKRLTLIVREKRVAHGLQGFPGIRPLSMRSSITAPNTSAFSTDEAVREFRSGTTASRSHAPVFPNRIRYGFQFFGGLVPALIWRVL